MAQSIDGSRNNYDAINRLTLAGFFISSRTSKYASDIFRMGKVLTPMSFLPENIGCIVLKKTITKNILAHLMPVTVTSRSSSDPIKKLVSFFTCKAYFSTSYAMSCRSFWRSACADLS